MRIRKILWCAGVCCILSVSGCFSSNPEDINVFLKPNEAVVTADTYILQPPDEMMIVSSKVPELAGSSMRIGHTQVIRPDGKISLESVGEIQVAGKTCRQVAELIAEQMKQFYKLETSYPVDVRVVNRSKYYYVIGEVRNPGAQIFSGRETTLSAIAKAIILLSAWEEKIQIIRPLPDLNQKPKIFELDLKAMTERGDMTSNVLLQEGDIIYVPPTVLASVGRVIGEITGPIFSSTSSITSISGL
ncbi:MAG: polysaccharide biosynthesis/export family protein [Sedimentisphaerales bacterium]|nr:polysaccharide biosynthesis/export family protein [Sedimentisphaerales bacterium]